MLVGTERAALLICEINPNISDFGKVSVIINLKGKFISLLKNDEIFIIRHQNYSMCPYNSNCLQFYPKEYEAVKRICFTCVSWPSPFSLQTPALLHFCTFALLHFRTSGLLLFCTLAVRIRDQSVTCAML